MHALAARSLAPCACARAVSTTTLTRERLAMSSRRVSGVAAVEYTTSCGAACSAFTTASMWPGCVSGSSPWMLMTTSYA
jgi:hypothetical protein